MVVTHGTTPQATTYETVETAPEADVRPGTITIPATTICGIWATMSQAQAVGSDGERVLLGQRGEGPHQPASLIGLPAQQPEIRAVTLLAGGPR